MRQCMTVAGSKKSSFISTLVLAFASILPSCGDNEQKKVNNSVKHLPSSPQSASSPQQSPSGTRPKTDDEKMVAYRIEHPAVYSFEFNIQGGRTKIKDEGAPATAAGAIIYTLVVTPANPTVYAVVRVKGVGLFIIPERVKEADDRKVFVTFAAAKEWAGKDFTVEIWRDNSRSDKFWRLLLSTITFEATADVKGMIGAPVHPAIPVEASASAGASLKIKIDEHTWEGVTLVEDKLLGQGEGKVPEYGKSTEVALSGEIKRVFNTQRYRLGKLVLENHGSAR